MRFSDLRVRHVVGDGGSSVTVVCGLYNAKNGMGGYNGFSPFYYVREVADKRGEPEQFDHRHAGQIELVDAGDEPVLAQANQTDYSDLCVSTLALSDDQVMLTTVTRSVRAESAKMQAAARQQAVANADSSNSSE